MTPAQLEAIYANEMINNLLMSGLPPFANAPNDPVLKVIVEAQSKAFVKVLLAYGQTLSDAIGNKRNNVIDLTDYRSN